MIDGLARVLRTETSTLTLVTLALSDQAISLSVQRILQVFKSTISKTTDDYEPEYVEQDGMLYVNRLVEADYMNAELHVKTSQHRSEIQEFGQAPPLTLVVESPGLLDSMRFHEDSMYTDALEPHRVEIEVQAIGMNFMDCLTALGRINQDTLGGERSGIVSRTGSASDFQIGDRVCAVVLGCFKTYARPKAELVTKIPDELPFTEAASLPVTFATSYYGLVEVARLQREESVLIHSASGGTGQSAIQIAQWIGAEVFVTVGSDEKKKLVMDTYGIPEDHIFYSRNTTFSLGIMRMTKGHGVNVILNSLAGKGLVSSWECIASFGRFVEMGKRDIQAHSNLPMIPFAKNVSFNAIDLAAMSVERPSLLKKTLRQVMDLVMDKKLRAPHPLTIYSAAQVLDAFRFMQSGKNTGKTAIKINKKDMVPVRRTLYFLESQFELTAMADYSGDQTPLSFRC